MAETIAELEGCGVVSRGKRILGPLSLRIGKGEFWGVVGPNGAGKSTLLKVMAGLQPVSEGRLRITGTSSGSGTFGAAAERKRRIGLLLQHHDFYPDMPFTVRDVVAFGRIGLRGPGRRFGKNDREAVERAVSSLNLEHLGSRLYRELSGGERRKVQIARLIAQEAELLLLDEPTAGLDLDWQERLTLLVEHLYVNRGKTIVMVTHDIDRLPACCTHTLLLKNGGVLAAGTPSEVFRSEILSGLYDSAVEVVERKGRYHAFCLDAEETG